MNKKVINYLKRDHYSVHGWLVSMSGRVTAEIGLIQEELGVRGGVAEIGVHHGKFLILLMLVAPNEYACAVDIFGRQELNSDNSGKGDKEIFLENASKICGRSDIHVISESSFNVKPKDFTSPVRLFSVDGGHTTECTINDLNLAAEALADGGVIILDDVFNEAWPEVAGGLAKFLNDDTAKVVPFALSPNKVFLCSPSWRERYRTSLSNRLPNLFDRSLRIFGHESDIYGVKSVQRSYIRYGTEKLRGLLAKIGL